MGTRNSILSAVAILVVAGASFPVFAGPVLIYGGEFDLPIPALNDPEREYGRGWMEDAIIEIPGDFTIYDIDVSIILTHTNVFDLQISLHSPAGTNVALNVSGNMALLNIAACDKNIIFEDEAELSIEDDSAFLLTDHLRPLELLSLFDGESISGEWRLKIHDAFYNDTGNLNRFELIITTPEPTTAILLTFGIGLLALSKPNRSS